MKSLFGRLVLMLGLFSGSVAAAEVIEVGGRTLQIPAPEGFERSDGVLPVYDEVCESMLPPSNQRRLAFARPEFVAKLRAGDIEDTDRHFCLQTLAQVEAQEISLKKFRAVREEIKKEMEGMRNKLEAEAKKLIDSGKAKLAEQQGIDLQMSVSDTAILGFFEETDSALGFTMVMKVSTEAGPSWQVCAAVMAPVAGRLLSFYAYSDYKGDADRAWAEGAAQQWKDAAQAINPQVEGSVLDQLNFGQVGRSGLIGGVVGLVIGLVQWLRRRNAPKAA